MPNMRRLLLENFRLSKLIFAAVNQFTSDLVSNHIVGASHLLAFDHLLLSSWVHLACWHFGGLPVWVAGLLVARSAIVPWGEAGLKV